MDWLKFFVLVLSGVFAVYQYAMVRHDLISHHSTPDLPSRHEPSNLDTIVYVRSARPRSKNSANALPIRMLPPSAVIWTLSFVRAIRDAS